MKYVLKNCNIIDVENDCKILARDILINDGIIEKIGDFNERDYETVNLEGQYLMPGLINMHVHLFGTGKPNKILGGGKLQKAVIKLVSTKLGKKILNKMVFTSLKNQLYSGVTTVRGVGDFYYSDVLARNKINSKRAIGPDLYVSGPAITAKGGHGDGTFAYASNDIKELQSFVDKNVEMGVDLIKICITGGVMDAKKLGEPGEVKMTLEQAKAVCDRAHELGKKVASHTESPEGVHIAVLSGVDTIEHSSPFTEEDLKAFKERNGAIISTFSPAVPLANLPAEYTKLNEMARENSKVVLNNMVTSAKQCIESGVLVGMGTDSSCPYATQYSMPNEVFFFEQYVGCTNAEAIISATKTNAKILGIDNEVGSISEGKKANFIIMKDNPVNDLDALLHLSYVAINGTLIESPTPKRKAKLDAQINKLKYVM